MPNRSFSGAFSARFNPVFSAISGRGRKATVANLLIIAGQSQGNSNGTVGSASGSTDVPAQLQGVMPNVYLWDHTNQKWVGYSAEINSAIHLDGNVDGFGNAGTHANYWGAEAQYAYLWTQKYPGVPLFIYKKCHSSTAMDPAARVVVSGSNRAIWDINTRGELYDQLVTTLGQCRASLIAAGYAIKVRAFNFVQGESDAGDATIAARYQTNLTNFINAIRNAGLIAPSDLFCISRINTGWTAYQQLQASQMAVGEGQPNCCWFDCDNLPLASDNVHYNPAGVVDAGRRMFQANLSADELLASYVVRMTTPPSAARQVILRALFQTLRDKSLLGGLVDLKLLANVSQQAALLNLVDERFVGAQAGFTFTPDQGATGSGSGSLINTTVQPASADGRLSLNEASYSAYLRGSVSDSSATVAMGCQDANSTALLFTPTSAAQGSFRVHEFGTAAGNTIATMAGNDGLFSMVRTAASSQTLYRNGAAVQTDTAQAAQGPIPAVSVYVGARNGGSGNAARQFCASVIGGKRTANQEAALFAALNTYLKAIGAVS